MGDTQDLLRNSKLSERHLRTSSAPLWQVELRRR